MGVGGGVGLHGLSRLEEGTKAWTAAPQASGGLIGVCLGGGRMRQQVDPQALRLPRPRAPSIASTCIDARPAPPHPSGAPR